MRFAVDAHAIGRHLTGNEVYVRSLLNGFASLDRKSEFITYLSVNEAAAWVPRRFAIRHVSGNPFIRLGWQLSRQLRRDQPQLIHVQYTAPVACPVPIVVTVHDVSFLEYPDYFPRSRSLQLRWTVRRTIRNATKILTGSEFSRAAIAKAYNLDSDRIVVVSNAAARGFRPLQRESVLADVRSRFRVAGPFVLSVGDLQPRKNQIGLIKAFARLIRAHPQLRHDLVLAGKHTWFAPRVLEAAKESGAGDRIHFAGFVTDEELLRLYNACDCFVFPSFYEGFGLPVLEAMACGRAVACSNASALPEVADGAGLLFDPHSPGEIARAMYDLLIDPELRLRMERLGLQRSTHFSWQKAAQKTLEVYYDVVERNRPASPKMSPVPISRQ